jgi:ankyrin repeat protein
MSATREWRNVDEILDDMAALPEFSGLPRPKINSAGGFGNRPLKIAAVRGDIRAIEMLVAAGAELDARNEHGYTALQHAVEQGHLPAVQRLVELGASTDVLTDDGFTPLQEAEILKHHDIVAFLSKRRA